MTRRCYTTPTGLQRALKDGLRMVGFDGVSVTRPRYTTVGGLPCLKVSVYRYAALATDVATLEAYERHLGSLPGVLRTEIVTGHKSLRNQVAVIHRREWDEHNRQPAQEENTVKTTGAGRASIDRGADAVMAMIDADIDREIVDQNVASFDALDEELASHYLTGAGLTISDEDTIGAVAAEVSRRLAAECTCDYNRSLRPWHAPDCERGALPETDAARTARIRMDADLAYELGLARPWVSGPNVGDCPGSGEYGRGMSLTTGHGKCCAVWDKARRDRARKDDR